MSDKKSDKKSDKRKHAKKASGAEMAGGASDALAWAGPAPAPYDEQRARVIERLCDMVRARLSGHRLEHTLSVAQTAARLAHRHGVDPFLAQAAGLLHDWDKRLSPDELWAKVDEYGVDLGAPRDPRMLPTLHGLTAAASLRRELDLPDEVFQAIARHTTGAAGMSDLDIVVYVADMLEPLRKGDLDDLRALAGTGPLDALFAACARQSLLYLVQAGRFVHPAGVEAWNAYESRLPDGFRA